ncbi:hypothetical protein ES707_19735 [subsurface metagenome]
MERLLLFNIFRLILLVCLILFGFGCEKNPVDTEDYTYWTTPEWDGVYLSFHHSEDIEVDSVLAGNIQYRLDVARNVDEQLTGWGPFPHWLSDQLILNVTDDVSTRFNTSTLRFEIKALDTLLDRYPIWRGDKYSTSDNMLVLYFVSDYNMPKLAEVFEGVEGVVFAEPNGVDYIYPPPDVELTIDGDTYRFIFIGGWDYPGNWEIHVVNDQATVISEP